MGKPSLFIYMLWNIAEKRIEFVTSNKEVTELSDIADPEKYTWGRTYMGKKSRCPSKWALDGLLWEDVKNFEKICRMTSGYDSTLRIKGMTNHKARYFTVAWSDKYIHEDLSYWVHFTGPIHWNAMTTLGYDLLYPLLKSMRDIDESDFEVEFPRLLEKIKSNN